MLCRVRARYAVRIPCRIRAAIAAPRSAPGARLRFLASSVQPLDPPVELASATIDCDPVASSHLSCDVDTSTADESEPGIGNVASVSHAGQTERHRSTQPLNSQQNEAKKKKKTDAEIEDFFSRLMPLLDEVRFRRLCSTTATLADNMKAPKSRPFKLLKKAFLARVEKLLRGNVSQVPDINEFVDEFTVERLEHYRVERGRAMIRELSGGPDASSADSVFDHYPGHQAPLVPVSESISDFASRVCKSVTEKQLLLIIRRVKTLESARQKRVEAGQHPFSYTDCLKFLQSIWSILETEELRTGLMPAFQTFAEQIEEQHFDSYLPHSLVNRKGKIPKWEVATPSGETVEQFCARVVRKLPESMYTLIARFIFKIQCRRAAREAEGLKLRESDLRLYLNQVRNALGDLKGEFFHGFHEFIPVLTVNMLEETRSAFEKDEVYRLVVFGDDGVECSDPCEASSILGESLPDDVDRRFMHKVFVDNLPADINANKLAASFSPFGGVVAVEFFKERAPKRALTTTTVSPPTLRKFKIEELVPQDDEPATDAASQFEIFDKLHTEDALHEEADGEANAEANPDDANDGAPGPSTISSGSRAHDDKGKRRRARMKPKPVPESHLYAAVYFDSAESARRAMQVSVRIFGVAIEDTLTTDARRNNVFRSCRSSLPPSALYVGNLPFDICGYAVENSLASLLRQQSIQGHGLQGCIQTDQFNIGRGSVIARFACHEDALRAYRALARKTLNGRPLRIGWIREREMQEIQQRSRRKSYIREKKNTLYSTERTDPARASLVA
ncbi:RRM domain-containing protein [Plasmodiophora brassicae]